MLAAKSAPPSGERFSSAQLARLLTIGFAALGAWLAVLFTIAPHRLLTFLAFLLPLGIFVSMFTAAILYGLQARNRYPAGQVGIRVAVRQGCLLGILTAINLGAAAARHWSVVLFIAVVAAEGAIEVALWARSPQSPT